MKGLDRHINPDFETELRAMLRRRADDVEPSPPDWRDLLDRADAVVVSLQTGRPVDDALVPASDGRGSRWSRGWGWVRPIAAAAACLAVVMAAGIAIGRSSTHEDDSHPADDQHAAAGPTAPAGPLPAAGSGDFHAAQAPALYPQRDEAEIQAQLDAQGGGLPRELDWMADPTSAAEQYLTSVGIRPAAASFEVRVDPAIVGLEEGPDRALVETATAWWSVRELGGAVEPGNDLPVVTMGRVFLRNLTSPAAPAVPGRDAWVVVGAATRGLNLGDVRREGDQLHFVVTSYTAPEADRDITGLPLRVLVDDREVSSEPLPAETRAFTASVAADQAATVRLQQFDGEQPVSVTETVFPPTSELTENPTPTTTQPSLPEIQPRVRTGIARFGQDCAPDNGVSVQLELPPGFGTEPTLGGADDPASPTCVFTFTSSVDPGGHVVVAWGAPGFTPPALTEGPACFPWVATDDGGFVAIRAEPLPIYVVGENLTSDRFAQLVDSIVVAGSDTWAADEGC